MRRKILKWDRISVPRSLSPNFPSIFILDIFLIISVLPLFVRPSFILPVCWISVCKEAKTIYLWCTYLFSYQTTPLDFAPLCRIVLASHFIRASLPSIITNMDSARQLVHMPFVYFQELKELSTRIDTTYEFSYKVKPYIFLSPPSS